MMKKLFLFLALLSALPAVAQIDIPITAIGPYRDLLRNVTWTGSGQTAINNNYVLTPAFSNEGLCLYLQNNDTNAHSINVTYFGTGDQTTTQYTGNTGKWSPAGPNGTVITSASGTAVQYVRVQGVAKLVISLNNGTGAGSVTATIAESQNGTACGNTIASGAICPFSSAAGVTFTSSGTGTLALSNIFATQRIYICQLIVSWVVQPSTGGTVTFFYGGGAVGANTCSSVGISEVTLQALTTTPQTLTFGSGTAAIISPFTAGSDMVGEPFCINNSSGQSLLLSYTFNIT